MSWYKNWSLGKKLISAFLAIAVLAGVIGVIGSVGLNSTTQKLALAYEHNTKPIADIGSWLEQYASMKVVVRDALISSDPAYQASRKERFDELKGQMEVSLNEYAKGISDEGERNAYLDLVRLYGEYLPELEDAFRDVLNGNQASAVAKVYSDKVAQMNNGVNDAGREIMRINMGLAEKDLQTNIVSTQRSIALMITVSVIGMVLAIALGIYIARLITRPVQELVEASRKVADGDLNVTIDLDSKDEIGKLAQAFQTMADSTNEVLQNIANASDQVASGSRQVSEASQTLSQGSTEQASSIQQLTASMEQIASQTKQNAQSAEEASRLAVTASMEAEQGNKRMKGMLTAMEDINESSGNISKIIKVIDEIAFQTNILALNAAVEAARAGQHGKGFAVVAEEVRNLAARSANAAKETTALIEGSIKKVEAGTKIANDTAEALEKIVVGAKQAAELVGSIASASNEQAAGITQVNQGIAQVSDVIQANSATSEECAAASEELSGQSEQLKEMVSRFRLKRGTAGSYRSSEAYASASLNGARHASTYAAAEPAAAAPGKVRIQLDDADFGKYE